MLPGRSDSLSRFVVSDALDEFATNQLGGGVGPAGDGLHLQGTGVTGDNGLDLVGLGVDLVGDNRGGLGLLGELLIGGTDSLAESETILNVDFLPGTSERHFFC